MFVILTLAPSGFRSLAGANRLRWEVNNCDFESLLNSQITFEQEEAQFYLELSYVFKARDNHR